MNKRLLCLGLTVLLVLASAVSVFAEDRQGASGWQVSFDGQKMNSNFSTANMDDEIYAMQPGDTVELTIALKNDYNGQADWYMKNEVLETLEDAADAAGSAYGYLLTYTDVAGETSTLYYSESLGGEGRINGVGLHGATTTLQNYFYLDRMGSGDTGTVKLKVSLDGETEGNAYQDTLARLQMDFAVEPVAMAEQPSGTAPTDGGDSDNSPKNGTTKATESTQNSTRDRAVQTGDDTQIMLYVALMLLSGVVLLILALMRMRRDREDEAALESGSGSNARTQGARAARTARRRRR